MRKLLPLFLALTACEEETACTTEAIGSVSVTVVDADGAAIPGATVTYTVDGGAVTACESPTNNGSFVCGWEVAGEFTVTASAPGLVAASQTVTVEAGECHVTPEAVEIALTEPECLDDGMIYAVTATLVGASGEALTDPLVTWQPNDDSTIGPSGCDQQDADTWLCAMEQTGPLRITGTASGHTTVTADLVIEDGGCHPVPAEVTLTVDWLPD